MPIPCARCSMPLSDRALALGDLAPCGLCGAPNEVRVFPAALQSAPPVRPEAALDGEAACFDHPSKRAVAACRHCGRFVCQLCSVEFGEEIWCPSCVTSRAGSAERANLETSRTLYDSVALSVPLVSLADVALYRDHRPGRRGLLDSEVARAPQPGAPKPLAFCGGHPHRPVRSGRMVVIDRVRADADQGGGSLMPNRVAYRKLPGRRRGFLRGSSVWLGPDHLLLVKSMRFREEYKRYQLRDIQAIAIAHRPRFHISTRALGIAILWLIAYLSVLRYPRATILLWVVAVALVVAWFYVSVNCSCTCRIYTAVSRDEFPSVYRTWVARKFLRAVEREVGTVQGMLQGDWTEALEKRDVGPPLPLPPESAGTAAGQEPSYAAAPGAPSTHDYFLVATLLVDGLWHAFVLYHPAAWASVFSNLLALLVIGAAIFVLVRNRRRRARVAQKGLAIAALVAMALVYYVRLTVLGAIAGARAAIEKQSVSVDYIGGPLTGEVEMGITLLLGLAGLVILVAGRSANHEPGSVAS